MSQVNPITLAVVRNNLISIANGMQETAFRCGVTPFLYEIMDCCFGVLDAEAGVLAQSHGMLLFLGSLGPATRNCVDALGRETLEPGDVIISTCPSVTGAHTSDALLFTPVFYKGRLFGYASTKSHWLDLGAKDVFPTNARHIYEEGLRVPPVRIYRKGELQVGVWEIIKANSRAADLVWGDMQAQIAGCRFAEKQMVELLDKYGADTVRACVEEIYGHSERMIRHAVAAIPDGVYTAEDYLDDNGVDHEPIPVKVAITVSGDEITIDFTGSAPEQRGPMNGLLISTLAAARVGVKALTVPELPGNEGFNRPVKVIAPQGCIFNASDAAPSFLYAWVAQIALDLINKALHRVLPERVPALSGADVVGEGFAGIDPETGRYWGTLTPCVIGQGGDSQSDGECFLYPLSAGACKNTPTEVLESTYPLIVDRCELVADSGGAGRHRGGLGSRTHFRLRTPGLFFGFIEKGKTPHWGLFGGKDGLRNFALVQSKKQGEFEVLKHPGVELEAEDRVIVTAGGGGGYGDPLERLPETVLNDVRNGYVSLESARADYGVVLAADPLRVEGAATDALRASLGRARPA